MEKSKYAEDLRDIRDMMERSSRFISLSGWSGISAGLIALAGSYYAHRYILANRSIFDEIVQKEPVELLILAIIVLVLSITAGLYFTQRRANKRNEKIWTANTRRLLINLAIPLVTGGIVCLILFFNGNLVLVAPLTLIFYGLALINASKYTLSEIRSLGLLQIVFGLASLLLPGYGLVFWAMGFGVLHILYGILMKNKYGA
ncbi:MAG: hypothetical protein P8X57_05925 [Cyclobacteriaceae bacterium]